MKLITVEDRIKKAMLLKDVMKADSVTVYYQDQAILGA